MFSFLLDKHIGLESVGRTVEVHVHLYEICRQVSKMLNYFPIFFFFFLVFLPFLGLYLRHMEVPRLRVESELQLLAYTTATVTRDPSCICNLHHSSWQRWILVPLSEARD